MHNTCAEPVKNVSVNVGKSGKTKYVVGAYKAVKGNEGMDANHMGQKAVMKRLVENYDERIEPPISVHREGYTRKLKI